MDEAHALTGSSAGMSSFEQKHHQFLHGRIFEKKEE